MEQSLGLVEVKGLCSAIETADVMVKAANVTLVELEAARGSGMMTIKVIGDVGAVKAAVEAGRASALADESLVSVDVIARPTKELSDVFIRYPGKKEKPNFYGVEPEKPAAPEPEPPAPEPPAPEPETPATAPVVEEPSAPTVEAPVETVEAPVEAPAPKPRRTRRTTRRSNKTKKTTHELSNE